MNDMKKALRNPVTREIVRPMLSENQPYAPRVLVMEDNPSLNRLFSRALTNAGYAVVSALTLEQGRILLSSSSTHFNVFLCDMHMGNESSLILLRDLRDLLMQKGTQVVIVTGESKYQPIGDELTVDFFLEKPVSPHVLVTLVSRLTRQSASNATIS